MQQISVPVIRRAGAAGVVSVPRCSNGVPPVTGRGPLRPCAPHVLSPRCWHNVWPRQAPWRARHKENRDASQASDLAYHFAVLALAAAAAAAAAVGVDRRGCMCEESRSISFWESERPMKNPMHAMIKNLNFLYACTQTGKFEEVFTLEREIGKGAFGTVCLARHKGLGHRCAVKKIVKAPDENPGRWEGLKREIHALMVLDHPNIVKLITYFDEGPNVYLVFDLCEGPGLLQRCKEVFDAGEVFSERDAADILRQMLQAVRCCHSHYMGHFDVKPENFMYHRSENRHRLLMIHLGLSSRFKRDDRTICGTAEYMAPEVWEGVYGPEADIWSCGVVLFAMLTGKPFVPQATKEQIQKWVHDRNWVRQRLRSAQSQGLSGNAFDLLTSMLRHNRHQRPTAREALCHPFFAELHSVALFKAGRDSELHSAAEGVLERLLADLHIFASEPVFKRAVLLVMAHFAAYSFTESRPQRLAFAILDRHSDGELSLEALEAFFLRVDGKIPETLDADFSCVDVDDDGCITYTEFLSVTLPSSIRFNEQLVSTVFDFLDRDQDGTIDDADLAAAFSNDYAPRWMCGVALGEVCDDGSSVLSREQFLRLMCHPCEQAGAQVQTQ